MPCHIIFFKKCAKLFPNGNSTKISRGLPTPDVTCKAEYKMLSNNIRPARQKLTVYEKTHKLLQYSVIQCYTRVLWIKCFGKTNEGVIEFCLEDSVRES